MVRLRAKSASRGVLHESDRLSQPTHGSVPLYGNGQRRGVRLMTAVHQVVDLRCPASAAPEYVVACYHRRQQRNGRAVFTIGLPLSDVLVQREVEAQFLQLGSATGDAFQVSWEAAGGGPYPKFTGTIAFHHGKTESCTMQLRGSYEPPGGLLGKAFDAAVGQRIAERSIETFLQTMKREIEGAYSDDILHADPPKYPPSYE